MSRTVAMGPMAGNSAPVAFAEFTTDGYQWRALESHKRSIESGVVDWSDLAARPDAQLIKRNGQRDVWRLQLDGQASFVKLYHPKGLAARAKLLIRGPTAVQEWDVGRYAAAFCVSAVRPVACAWTGTKGWGGPSILITEAVSDAIPLNEYWLEIRGDRRRADALVESLARLIARAHQCGFQHGDMHPGNILVRPQRHACSAFFVDLHRVRTGRSVPLRNVVVNIVQLNQWFRRNATRSQRLRFLTCYLADRDRFAQASPYARNWRIDPGALAADLARQADRHANALWNKRDRRANRSGRYFTRIRPAHGWAGFAMLRSKHPTAAAVASRREYTKGQWQDWLADPLDWVDPEKHTLLKDSHSATVCRSDLPTEPEPASVIVKRVLPRNSWKRLTQMFGPSRNRRAWRIANMLINRDLPTAQPLAVIERFAGGVIRLDSLCFTEYMVGSHDLETFLTTSVASLPTDLQRRVKDRLGSSIVRLLKAFHARGFAHRDLKAPNLLVKWDAPYDGGPSLTLIDMEGIRHVGRPSERQKMQALVRLCVSLLSCPACTRTDCLRFLKSYLTDPGRTPWDWKAHWRDLHLLSASKLEAKEKRRAWKLKRYNRE